MDAVPNILVIRGATELQNGFVTVAFDDANTSVNRHVNKWRHRVVSSRPNPIMNSLFVVVQYLNSELVARDTVDQEPFQADKITSLAQEFSIFINP
jgi:ABC-type uncharacterized transport system permease subunit